MVRAPCSVTVRFIFRGTREGYMSVYTFLDAPCFPKFYHSCWTRSNVAFTETKLGAEPFGVHIPVDTGDFFSSPKRPDRLWELTKSRIQWVTGGFFPLDIKRSERDINDLPPFNFEVAKQWSYTFSSTIRLWFPPGYKAVGA